MNKKILLIMSFVFLIGTSTVEIQAQNEPEPYCSIRLLPFDDHGWFLNGKQIELICALKTPKVAIEVGSWLGTSTRFIAQHLPEDGKLYAVDTWLGSNEALHQKDARLPRLYHLFLSNVKHAGLTSKIIPIRMKSLEAAQALDVMADLIYIDAGHDEKSVYEDILAWHTHLKEGGVMCGDDWYYFPTVQRAVIRAANKLNKTISYEGNFWWFN